MAKPSFPKSKNERAYAHLQVLFEINARLQIIESVKQINAPFGIAREICYLQLRHICELVAIGSVIVQGDYTSSPDFTGEYAPSKVFKSLDKHYPGSFPQTLVIEKGENGIQFKCNVSRNEMTRKEMEELWGRTGNFLHRLKLKNFFREETELNIWPEIDQHTAKLKALLNPHAIAMHKPKILVCASLYGDGGHPDLAFLEYKTDGTMEMHQFKGRGETAFWRGDLAS